MSTKKGKRLSEDFEFINSVSQDVLKEILCDPNMEKIPNKLKDKLIPFCNIIITKLFVVIGNRSSEIKNISAKEIFFRLLVKKFFGIDILKPNQAGISFYSLLKQIESVSESVDDFKIFVLKTPETEAEGFATINSVFKLLFESDKDLIQEEVAPSDSEE
jgi:hypothetical protein